MVETQAWCNAPMIDRYAWQESCPTSFSTLHTYCPSSSFALLEISSMHDFSVVIILHLLDWYTSRPFFCHVTEIGAVPVYVHSRTIGFPASTLESFSFFTKEAGTKHQRKERGKLAQYITFTQKLTFLKSIKYNSYEDKPFTKSCVVQESLPASLNTWHE